MTKQKRKRYYVGIGHANSDGTPLVRVMFKSADVPLFVDYPEFGAIVGPFRTKAGAELMRDNPRITSVQEAEDVAKTAKQWRA